MTVASNENQIQAQLLRHGMLNWVTRGVFLGYQRNYLELQVDDLFLGDDVWDPTTHTTNYAANARMSPTDVATAATWSKTNGIRLDFAFNGGGVALNGGASDQLLPAIKANKDAFGFINHTWDHPNLDCSSTNYIGSEIAQNITWAQQQGIPITPTEVVTGEHSGLANTRPGNPGTIDPPFFDEAPTVSATGGTLAAGTYDYALTAQSAAGETTASISPNVVTTGATSSVSATFTTVCHAVKFNLYRSPAAANTWSLVGSATRLANDPTDNGTAPLEVTITDTGAAGTPATLPTTNGASIAPYSQNPNYLAGVLGAGARYVATDASKTYPTDPMNVGGPQYPVGATFTETGAGGSFQAVPRYPNNVYYNVATRTQQLDEYNWIYLPPPNGICQNSSVNTCRSAPATWAQYVASENSIMFRHIMGNDPRPHFMHQTNLIGGADGGVLYGVIDPLLASYNTYFDRAGTPLVQLTTSQIAQTLARQDTWAANLAAGKITAWIQDGELHVKNTSTGAVDVPLTGTTVGDLYGGQRSGWTTIAAGAERVFTPNDPANVTAPNVSGTARAGGTLRTTKGSWSGTSPIDYSYQWQRCTSQGKSCVNIAGATSDSYDVTSTDTGNRLRAVVSAGNWISSVSQAASDVTAVVGSAPSQRTGLRRSAGLGPDAGRRQPRGCEHGEVLQGGEAVADQADDEPAALRGRPQVQAARHAPGRLADHVEAQQEGDRQAELPAPDRQQEAPAVGDRRHHQAEGQAGHRRRPLQGPLRQEAAQAEQLPRRGHGDERARAVAPQADDVQGGEGVSDDTAVPPGPRRRFRRARPAATDDGADEALAALHAEVLLLREDNSRLKAAQYQRADIGRLLDRARSVSSTDADTDRDSNDDDIAQLLVDGLVIRESLLADLSGDRALDGGLRGQAQRARRDRDRARAPAGRVPPRPERP